MPALMGSILWGFPMSNKEFTEISKILSSFSERRVLVIGDLMLDEYLWGKVQRISPEAPVPVIELNHEEYRLGGAANVALNLAALGAKVELLGICGKDNHAKILKKLLKKHKIGVGGIIEDESRPTTLKTRIGAVSQQIVRLDREDCSELSSALKKAVKEQVNALIPTCDAVIIEDYDKGLLSEETIAHILASAKKYKVPVAVDPKKRNFALYRGVDIFKPNYAEIQDFLGKHYSDANGFFEAAAELQAKLNCKHLVVTCGSKGLYVLNKGEEPKHLPSFAREVFDVSGAGDTVISALCLAYLADSDVLKAALIANHAAAVVVAKHGTATANCTEIWDSINA